MPIIKNVNLNPRDLRFSFLNLMIFTHKITQNSRSVVIILCTQTSLFFPYITFLECINHYFISLQGVVWLDFTLLE